MAAPTFDATVTAAQAKSETGRWTDLHWTQIPTVLLAVIGVAGIIVFAISPWSGYRNFLSLSSAGIVIAGAALLAGAILSTGIRVDLFGAKQKEASIQSGLIRLGHEIGSIDGEIGLKTWSALDAAGLRMADLDSTLMAVEHTVQATFPEEFEQEAVPDEAPTPGHVIK